MPKIKDIVARRIIDSRGFPTVETAVYLDSGEVARDSVPSGASKGSHEAVAVSAENAVKTVNEKIAPLLTGFEVNEQEKIDNLMIEKDGTENKKNLGANSILSVSLAVARAAGMSAKIELFEYLGGLYGQKTSYHEVIPLFNVINGGLHAAGSVSFQEFFIIPHEDSFSKALESGCRIYHRLKKSLKESSKNTNVGDEGGFAPHFEKNDAVLDLLSEVCKGQNIGFGLDVASSTFFRDGKYTPENISLPATGYIDFISELSQKYNLEVLEDPLYEDSWEDWKKLNSLIGGRIKLIGDDLLVTNITRLNKAIKESSCNGILVKVNQIGTLTETFSVIRQARKAGFTVIISHRSGETNDDFIADLAVGVGADYVKFGAPARGERIAKYNRLLAIYNR